jgi:hypothetical protein
VAQPVSRLVMKVGMSSRPTFLVPLNGAGNVGPECPTDVVKMSVLLDSKNNLPYTVLHAMGSFPLAAVGNSCN